MSDNSLTNIYFERRSYSSMSIAVDLFLISTLGLFGSFGHCAGMCGPLSVSFALSQQSHEQKANQINSFGFHLLLNLGRIISYGLVGIFLGSLGSLFFTNWLRQGMGVATGLLLVWLGLSRILSQKSRQIPIIFSFQANLHQTLSLAMNKVATTKNWLTPLILGLFWGLIPCGFLYVAQIKAVETGSLWQAFLTMLAFGLGTVPVMVSLGVYAARFSADRQNQLYQLGGWITLIIGVLTLLRTQAMIDYTGHSALILLILALVAKPVSLWWTGLLTFRRLIGVGAYILAIAHTFHMLDHSLNWNVQGISFMLPHHQRGLLLGIVALILMTPAALTSSDRWQQILGSSWRKIHLLTVPALILVAIHTIFLGSHYLGELDFTWHNQARAITIALVTCGVVVFRWLVNAPAKNTRIN